MILMFILILLFCCTISFLGTLLGSALAKDFRWKLIARVNLKLAMVNIFSVSLGMLLGEWL